MVFESITLQTDYSFLVDWWPTFPIGGLIGFILYMLANPVKVEKWGSIFSRLFVYFSKKAERHSVAADIQSRISSYIKNFNLSDALPYGIKFQWVTGKNFESFVQEGEVIVIMDNHRNNARNFVNALQAYVSKGFLPEIRSHVPHNVLIASELLIQEKIIQKERTDALDIFRNEIATKRSNKDIEKYLEKLKLLDKNGYFQHIFLPELVHVGHRFQDHETSKVSSEIWSLIKLLEYIATRDSSDETGRLDYDGEIIRLWIILVAKPTTIIWGTDPYTNRVNEAITKNYDSVYLMARGKNIKFIEDLINATKTNTSANFRWTKKFPTKDRHGKKTEGIITLFRI